MADWFQKKVWVTREGQTVKVEDLETEHLRNIIVFLRRNAKRIRDAHVYRTYVLGPMPGGDMAMDAFEGEFTAALEADPWQWLRTTPLVKRLRKEYLKRLAEEAGVDGL